MIEYNDGRFSDIMEAEEAFERFTDEVFGEAAEDGQPQALHVGTKEDLQERKEKRSLEERLDDLEERLESVEGPDRPSVLELPSEKEIRRFGQQPTEES